MPEHACCFRVRSRAQERDKEPLQERFFRPHFLQAPGDMVAHEGRLCRLDCKVDSSTPFLVPNLFIFCICLFVCTYFCLYLFYGCCFFGERGLRNREREREHFFAHKVLFGAFNTRQKYFIKSLSVYILIKITLILYQVNSMLVKTTKEVM